MPKVKLPRKSTHIDMTAMCDVAFLLLTFFMLATKFKPPEAVQAKTPNSVSSEIIPDKDALLITVDVKGRVFMSMNDKDRGALIANINTSKGLGLSPEEIEVFKKEFAIGVPFSKLKGYLALSQDDRNKVIPSLEGIPCADSSGGELREWVHDAAMVFQGREANFMIKADGGSKYPVFKNVIEAFKKNDIFRFKLVTTPEAAPAGSPLYLTREKGVPAAK